MPDRLLLFDIDGTLLTSAGIAGRIIADALARVAGRPVDMRGYSFAGRTDPEIVRDLLLGCGVASTAIDACVTGVLDEYARVFAGAISGATTPRLHPGIRLLLDRLTGEPRACVGLLTGNIQRGAEIKLDHFGIRHYFRIGAYGSDAADRNALVEVAVRRARAVAGIDFAPRQVVLIGDTPRDIACAHAYGARIVAVATGTCSLATLAAARPDALFADLSDTDRVVAALLG